MFSLGEMPRPSHAAGFGLRMMGQPTKSKEAGVFRGVVPAIGLFVGLLPAMAQAQTNIDQGKSAAEVFANDCATCHKSARGLANGRGSSGLASFLVEHYTASKDQAASLAAYVMGAGGGEAAPATHGPKPASPPDRNRASAEPEAPPTRIPGKPDQLPPAAGRQGPQPAIANRNRPASNPSTQQPAAAIAEPAPSSPSAQDTSPAAVPGQDAAAPANADSGENAPVPRDNIPD
jgi:mono/diheme cytochrome c family protein